MSIDGLVMQNMVAEAHADNLLIKLGLTLRLSLMIKKFYAVFVYFDSL